MRRHKVCIGGTAPTEPTQRQHSPPAATKTFQSPGARHSPCHSRRLPLVFREAHAGRAIDIGLRLLHPTGMNNQRTGPRGRRRMLGTISPQVRTRRVSGWIGGVELAGDPRIRSRHHSEVSRRCGGLSCGRGGLRGRCHRLLCRQLFCSRLLCGKELLATSPIPQAGLRFSGPSTDTTVSHPGIDFAPSPPGPLAGRLGPIGTW